jgi:hypothetical protein
MNERLDRLARLFYTLQQCTERVLRSEVEVGDDAYRLAVTRIGQMLMAIGEERLSSESTLTRHWINRGEESVDNLLRTLPGRGRTVTAADVAKLMESAPGPDDPSPSMRRRS